jgi:hypothetical protein
MLHRHLKMIFYLELFAKKEKTIWNTPPKPPEVIILIYKLKISFT